MNVHPLPDTSLNGHVYDMGNFMSKELRLDQVAGFCRATYALPKPAVLDEDNAASMYRDTTGWTIHRKRAWAALMNGCHYDYIDFSITVGNESGTPASQRGIRSWMQHLSEFASHWTWSMLQTRHRLDQPFSQPISSSLLFRSPVATLSLTSPMRAR